MTESTESMWEDLPIQPEEVELANVLDAALEQLARGDASTARSLLARTPQLRQHGEELLEQVRLLLAAAAGLRDQERLLQSDLLGLYADEPPPAKHDDSLAPSGDTMADPSPTLPDPFPGEFRVERKLGAGTFGTVWLAEDLNLCRPVALKTVCPPTQKRVAERSLQRLREEARLLGSLRHRNIVESYAWRVSDTAAGSGARHYLVLQYVPGGSLADRVRHDGPLSWQQAARYIADVAEGLLEIHSRGIVHRDVKPANILWNSETDEALLTDFGISVRLREGSGVAGTPYYMPPEAFEGVVAPAQDVYGLAASLFWLVAGSVPFPVVTQERLQEQIRQGLPNPEPRCAELPGLLERLIRAGLDPDPARRLPLREFVTILRGALNQLLADNMLRPAAQVAAGQVRLTVSRQVDRHTFHPLATTHPAPERTLRDLKRVPPQPERVEVQTGERVRIEVEVDRPGYVTVFNVGPTGNLNLLYPVDLTRQEPAPARKPLHILDIELTPPAGQERLFALWSRAPLPLRLDELATLAQKGELPVSGPYRATRDMVRVQESVQRLRPEEWQAVVLELSHLAPGGPSHEEK
jgi:serine/threonine protein kinase